MGKSSSKDHLQETKDPDHSAQTAETKSSLDGMTPEIRHVSLFVLKSLEIDLIIPTKRAVYKFRRKNAANGFESRSPPLQASVSKHDCNTNNRLTSANCVADSDDCLVPAKFPVAESVQADRRPQRNRHFRPKSELPLQLGKRRKKIGLWFPRAVAVQSMAQEKLIAGGHQSVMDLFQFLGGGKNGLAERRINWVKGKLAQTVLLIHRTIASQLGISIP